MSHSWFVPACQHLVSHVSLPHVFTLHSSSVTELCSYWLGGIWAGMLHSWNWQSFHVSKGESHRSIFKHMKSIWFLNGKKCQVLLVPEPLQQFGTRELIRLFSPVLLSFFSSSTWMFSVYSYSFLLLLTFLFYFPFLCLVLLFQFWIY